MEKKLYRVPEGKTLTGVCTGLAEYFDMDLTLVRVLAVAAGVFLTVPAVVAYAIASFAIPEKPEGEETAEEAKEEAPAAE